MCVGASSGDLKSDAGRLDLTGLMSSKASNDLHQLLEICRSNLLQLFVMPKFRVATLVSSWSEGFQARLCQEHNSAYIDKPHTESVDLMLYRIGGNKQAAGEFPCSNSGYIFSAHETEYFWG
ncbi:uncharacterized protein [Physcomitrium patens]|uniref:uncharacterized protein n=1 Tax=Physcomitrium patens TaxID=3218 RepID=UPI003CCCB90A